MQDEPSVVMTDNVVGGTPSEAVENQLFAELPNAVAEFDVFPVGLTVTVIDREHPVWPERVYRLVKFERPIRARTVVVLTGRNERGGGVWTTIGNPRPPKAYTGCEQDLADVGWLRRAAFNLPPGVSALDEIVVKPLGRLDSYVIGNIYADEAVMQVFADDFGSGRLHRALVTERRRIEASHRTALAKIRRALSHPPVEL